MEFSTIIQFMWQDDIRAVASFIKEYLDVYPDIVSDQVLASDQP